MPIRYNRRVYLIVAGFDLQCRKTALLVGVFWILIFLVGSTEITGKIIFLNMYDVQKSDKKEKKDYDLFNS